MGETVKTFEKGQGEKKRIKERGEGTDEDSKQTECRFFSYRTKYQQTSGERGGKEVGDYWRVQHPPFPSFFCLAGLLSVGLASGLSSFLPSLESESEELDFFLVSVGLAGSGLLEAGGALVVVAGLAEAVSEVDV